MKRVIKFRGKRVDNSEWVFGYYFFAYRTQQFAIMCDSSMGVLVDREFEVIPESVGQFTGLTDKNGKEIFEGDIMKTDLFTKTFQITFGNSEKWGASFCHQSHNSIYFLNKNFTDTSEVIGNIYENKELLK